MDVIEAIHARRTVKEYRPDPVDPAVLNQVLEAARWAPNHRLTEPWRLRVLGPAALERLRQAAGAGGEKLLRAPTLIVASFVPSPLPLHAREDEQAAACAIYAVLLAAHAHGLASFWRTPGVLRSETGRAAVGLEPQEQVLGLIHLGHAAETPPPVPERAPLESFVSWLD